MLAELTILLEAELVDALATATLRQVKALGVTVVAAMVA
jgi:hypothetical protein